MRAFLILAMLGLVACERPAPAPGGTGDERRQTPAVTIPTVTLVSND